MQQNFQQITRIVPAVAYRPQGIPTEDPARLESYTSHVHATPAMFMPYQHYGQGAIINSFVQCKSSCASSSSFRHAHMRYVRPARCYLYPWSLPRCQAYPAEQLQFETSVHEKTGTNTVAFPTTQSVAPLVTATILSLYAQHEGFASDMPHVAYASQEAAANTCQSKHTDAKCPLSRCH